jgi:hypothetical protein
MTREHHPLDTLKGLPRSGLDWCDECDITVECNHVCYGSKICPRMKAREMPLPPPPEPTP